jgi:hypothetical protein
MEGVLVRLAAQWAPGSGPRWLGDTAAGAAQAWGVVHEVEEALSQVRSTSW